MGTGDSRTADWIGVADRQMYNQWLVEKADRLADAAKAGDWTRVFDVLEGTHDIGPNQWRVGGSSWYAPLHQAAWHGAPVEVVEKLIALGAWKSLRDSTGLRALDIARERNHAHLLDVLDLPDLTPEESKKYERWDDHLHRLIGSRTRELPTVPYRRIPTEVMVLENLDTLWFPYPGMTGGFSISTHRGRLFVESWFRLVGGSGQAHVITEKGCVLVDQGVV